LYRVPSSWKNFLFPSLTRGFALRLLAVAVSAVVLFGTILIPFRIQGHSMAPTYRDGGFNFCNTLRYVWTPPQRRDVVAVRLAGNRIMLLKRVVALEGDRVAFHDGRLVVNGETVAEPYVVDPRPWNLAPRTVARGHVYVVGDNRRVPMDVHLFGQTPRERIVGGPLW
jgi:signal peptidase I